eukprot:7665508-Pyramimonas_sp.AAC.1
MALVRALLAHPNTPVKSKAAMQVYWGGNINAPESNLQVLQDQVRYCRMRPTCYNRKKKEQPKFFKL